MRPKGLNSTATRDAPAPALLLAAAIAVVAGGLVFSDTTANAQSARVRSACAGDYHRFCPAYAVGSPQLRSCMRTVGKRLSPACLDALVDSGEIPRKDARRR